MKAIVPLIAISIIVVIGLLSLPIVFGGLEADFAPGDDAGGPTTVVQMAQPVLVIALIGIGVVILALGLKRLSRIRA
ncbi:MAG: hypothetical protein WC683_11855 [bacterium]